MKNNPAQVIINLSELLKLRQKAKEFTPVTINFEIGFQITIDEETQCLRVYIANPFDMHNDEINAADGMYVERGGKDEDD